MKKLIKKIIREEIQKAHSFVNKDGKLNNFELTDYDKGAINQLANLEDWTSEYRNKKMVFTYFTDITVYKSKKKGSISDPQVKIEVVRLTGNFTANGFTQIIPKTNKLDEKMFEVKFKKWPILFNITENNSSYPISEEELGTNMMNKVGLIYGFNQKPELASSNIPEEEIYNRSTSFFITPKNIEAIEFFKLLTDLLKSTKK